MRVGFVGTVESERETPEMTPTIAFPQAARVEGATTRE